MYVPNMMELDVRFDEAKAALVSQKYGVSLARVRKY